MIDQETIKQLQKISVSERIHLMEILLNSLKQDIKNIEKRDQLQRKRFTVRPFNLGREIHVDRDILYVERGL